MVISSDKKSAYKETIIHCTIHQLCKTIEDVSNAACMLKLSQGISMNKQNTNGSKANGMDYSIRFKQTARKSTVAFCYMHNAIMPCSSCAAEKHQNKG